MPIGASHPIERGDPEGQGHLVATANYCDFQNGAVSISNFSGLGLGLEGKTTFGPWGDGFFKAEAVPLPVSSTTSALAILEVGSHWIVAPNVSLNVGYKGQFCGLTMNRQGTVTGSTQPVDVHLSLWDVCHGPVVGSTFVF